MLHQGCIYKYCEIQPIQHCTVLSEAIDKYKECLIAHSWHNYYNEQEPDILFVAIKYEVPGESSTYIPLRLMDTIKNMEFIQDVNSLYLLHLEHVMATWLRESVFQ